MRIGAAASCTGEAAAGHKHKFWHDSAEKWFIKVKVAQKGQRQCSGVWLVDCMTFLVHKIPLFLRLSGGVHTPLVK